jgi:hypothetical protein
VRNWGQGFWKKKNKDNVVGSGPGGLFFFFFFYLLWHCLVRRVTYLIKAFPLRALKLIPVGFGPNASATGYREHSSFF